MSETLNEVTLSVVVAPVITKLPETVKSPVIVPPTFGNAAFAGLELFHTGSAPGSNNVDNGASRYYGTDQTYYLAEPNKWLAVRINNVNYVMPMYEV